MQKFSERYGCRLSCGWFPPTDAAVTWPLTPTPLALIAAFGAALLYGMVSPAASPACTFPSGVRWFPGPLLHLVVAVKALELTLCVCAASCCTVSVVVSEPPV